MTVAGPSETVPGTRAGSAPLRAEDALFLHAETAYLCQQVGAVLLLGSAPGQAAEFRAAMSERMRGVPGLRRRLERPGSRWQRPRWIIDNDIDYAARIRQITLREDGAPESFAEVVDAFFSARCDPYQNPWEMLLVRGLPLGRAGMAVKVHHAMGDSHAIIATLSKLFDPLEPAGPGPAGQGPAAQGPGAPGPGTPGSAPRDRSARELPRGAMRILRGFGHLTAAGPAPRVSVCGPLTSDRRRYVPLVLPARDVARTARALNSGITDLMLTVIAEALGQLLRSRGEDTRDRVVRFAVPRAQPAPPGWARRSWGNRTTAVSLDLPIGPLSPAERLSAVRGQIESHTAHGEQDAAALALRALNFLPLPLQRRTSAFLYQRRWFNLLVSVFPGIRRSYHVLGARVEEVHPVLALADGVGLAIGVMTWDRSLSVGILADAVLVADVDRLAAGISEAFRVYQDAAGQCAPS